jgi:predicted MFS family arabinose efflux permease
MALTQHAKVVLALGSAQTLAWGSSYYLPAILAVPMARDLGVSTGVVYGAFSAALIVTAMLGPGVGRRIDLFGGRGVLTFSSLLFATGLTTLGAAQDSTMLVVGWLVIGIGMATGLYEAAFATLAGIYGRNARGAITGITLLAGLASTICWPISAHLESEIGWRLACFVWAAAHVLIGLPLNRLLVPAAQRVIPIARNESSDTGPSDPAAASLHATILLSFVFAVTWFISTAMAAHLPRLLQEAGASPSAAIAAAALVGPAQVAARLVEFGVLQRFHPLLSARLAAFAHPLGAAVLLTFGPPAAVVFALLHGGGNGILTIAKGTLPLVIFGPSGYGHRQGIIMIPSRFAQAGAPLIFAILIERYGIGSLFLPMAAGLAALAALLALKSPSEVERA